MAGSLSYDPSKPSITRGTGVRLTAPEGLRDTRSVDEPPVEAPPVGTRLDAYRLTGVLGKGGMSTVYLAEEEGADRPCAVKVLEPRLARDDEFRQRFLRESKYASS